MIGKSASFIPEISLDGFQTVSGDLFLNPCYKGYPTCTLWYSSICFNKEALRSLNNCERIRIEVNCDQKCILIIPVTSGDKDGVRWSKRTDDPVTRKMECRQFTSMLYEKWNWAADQVFKAKGRIVSSDGKVMLLFDFSNAENWIYTKKPAAEDTNG